MHAHIVRVSCEQNNLPSKKAQLHLHAAGIRVEGSEEERRTGDKWCPLLASALHFKGKILLRDILNFFFFLIPLLD